MATMGGLFVGIRETEQIAFGKGAIQQLAGYAPGSNRCLRIRKSCFLYRKRSRRLKGMLRNGITAKKGVQGEPEEIEAC